jgi:hypothetical protein
MEGSTLEADRERRLALSERERERVAAWLYTGAPGRAASFSIDLALTFVALGLWSARRVRRRLRSSP